MVYVSFVQSYMSPNFFHKLRFTAESQFVFSTNARNLSTIKSAKYSKRLSWKTSRNLQQIMKYYDFQKLDSAKLLRKNMISITKKKSLAID